jgi:hypothetical protein
MYTTGAENIYSMIQLRKNVIHLPYLSPRNENLNLLVRIKSFNLFLYTGSS